MRVCAATEEADAASSFVTNRQRVEFLQQLQFRKRGGDRQRSALPQPSGIESNKFSIESTPIWRNISARSSGELGM